MVSIKEGVGNIDKKIQKEEDLGKINELLLEMKQKCNEIELPSLDRDTRWQIEVVSVACYISAFRQCRKFHDKWERKEITPTQDQIERARKLLITIKDIEKLDSEDLPPNFDVDDFRKFLKDFETKIQVQENSEQNHYGGENNNNSEENKQKITNLQNQIDALEEKIRRQPNSDSSSTDKKNLERLRTEIQSLKNKKGNKSKNQEESKDNFPYGLVIGGGIVIVLLLITVIFFWSERRKTRNH
ncbi:MAG: transmembrane domain-containing protein [Spiroplasmataceae bacterium]|nr:transmembrane domain-containing protein [Spiroplasmataceae bacterium]